MKTSRFATLSKSGLLLTLAVCGGCGNSGGTISGGGGGTKNTGAGGAVGSGGALSLTLPPIEHGGASGSSGGSTGVGGSTASSTAGNCGSVTSKAERMPADVLLVQDTSGSMTWSISEDCDCQLANATTMPCQDALQGAGTCVDRWSTLQTAVATAVSADSGIQWGLEFFASPKNPGTEGCNVDPDPQVPIASTSGAAIQSQLKSGTPRSSTPTAAAIHVATTYLKTVSDKNKKAILLATDGQPNCGGGNGDTSDLPNTLAELKAAYAAGFPVYVVGIGPSGSSLDSMAESGGTGKHYPASSPQQLTDALSAISKVVATCSYTSTTPPPDVNLISVYVDKQLVKKDASTGWDFGSNSSTIVLHGSVCDAVMSGKSQLVEIVFGCPGVTPPDVIP